MRTTLIPATVLALCLSAVGAAADRSFEKQLPLDPTGVVEISNTAGTVTVSGWDQPQVSVHAELDDGVERVDMDGGHARVNIKVVLPSGSSHHGEANLKVQVPRGSELHLTTVSADQIIGAVNGVQRLNSVSGEITTEIGGADLDLKTVSGDVRVKGHGQPARLHVTTVSGDIRMEHAAGDLDAGTVSGDMGLSLDTAGDVRLRTTSGDMAFQGKLKAGTNFDAASVSGDIKVRAPAEAGYGYEATTFSGEITDCFEAHTEKSTVGHSISGTRGAGNGRVRLKAMSGDVQLCDRN